MFAIVPLITRTDVTCVSFINDHILAGIGGNVSIFDEHLELTKTVIVFKGQQIFGIVPNGSQTKSLIYGENQLKVLNNLDGYNQIAFIAFNEWILSAKWINLNQNIATVSMHNNVTLWTSDLKVIQTIACAERCILYSAHLVNDTWEDLIALSGTVFSQILLWCPSKGANFSSVLARLSGHKGVIFAIDYNESTGVICSTSDDRSARLWIPKCKNLTSELKLEKPEFLLKCTMFCHTARVFRCLVLDDCILTTGEDSLLVVWSLDGDIIRKIETHQGASVWSLAYNRRKNVVMTGGGDCGITLFPLQQNIVQEEVAVTNSELLKKTGILSNGNIVCTSEKGALLLYDIKKRHWFEIQKHEDLASYSLLEVSKCRNLLALAGYCGSIHVYKLDLHLVHICTHVVSSKSRIFALHWLSSEQFLTCEAEGRLQVWSIIEKDISPKSQFILPLSKERWTTSSCICNHGHIAVGDRKGNIYIFVSGNLTPLQIIKKAHNYQGVTNLYFKENVLVSLGRNSTVKCYQFYKTTFSTLSLDKLPFSWITSIYEDNNNQYLLGFLGNEFVVWDYKKRRTLFQFHCGGGHRSWDFYKIDDNITFAFIKERRVNLIQFNSNVLNIKDLVNGFHFNEINGAACFPVVGLKKTVLISGGEDTTLRVSIIDYEEQPKFTTKSVFKSHLSSIRTIIGCKLKSELECEEYLVFSAGGRAQIILWNLEIVTRGEEVVPVFSEKYSYYEQLNDESETRIMDLCTIVVNACVILIAATSNGTLKIFWVVKDAGDYKIELIGDVLYKLKCILKLKNLTIHDHHVVLSTSTDGNIVFWDFTSLVNELLNNCTKDVKSIHIIKSIHSHASGINSLDYKILDNNQCLVLTGGDDNTINVALVSFDLRNAKLTIEVLSTFTDSESHCAQVTGAFLNDDHFVTSSIDQKLNISKWKVENNRFICQYKQTHTCNIADIQGMQIWKHFNILYAIVYGKGIELYQISETER
ncbi:hypothetical protein RN001_006578 [Aquatica leii]|uniref:tRNA (34-2'-O)-methyltransferase regulator WDR6 n=1 Tax=Aquatica leii TaxID=1421715 RepID=A0AAN7SJW9_9COLE|nr:hypothetical protein RN001_006578 [Aquatica leii]